jgi:hypothetical protein
MLESLENNEAILLMYLAGELPAIDRQEVDQMLAADPGLRGELDRLLASQAAVEQGLAFLDHAESLPSADIAVRRIGRAMRQQQVLLATQASRNRQSAGRRLGLPFWAYPGIAAAVVLVAFLVWVINYSLHAHNSDNYATTLPSVPGAYDNVQTPDTNPSIAPSPVADAKAEKLAEDLQNSFGPSTESDDNRMFALRDDPKIAVGSEISE